MKLRIALVASAFFAVNAFAVVPAFWRVRSAEDFLAGDIHGFAVTSRGELRPGPALTRLAGFNDPFVLSQASAPNGDRFFGTGNEGKVYRLSGSDLHQIYKAPESEVYAMAFHDGALYVGSSPDGKVYRVDPVSGKATVFFDPKQAYIWSMVFLPNGDLAVGTGVEGKLFRVKPDGTSSVLFDSPETHIRSLAVEPDGTLLAGGAAKGRIYEIRPDGSAHALYDSALNEIPAIYVDKNGVGWAAGVSGVLPTSAPAKPQPAHAAPQQPAAAGATPEEKTEEPSSNVEVTFSIDDQNAAATPQSGNAELYRINKDGFVEVVKKFSREMIYDVSGAPDGGVLLATGPQGRIYEFRDGEISLLASVPEKQVVSISTVGGDTIVTTTNSGAVYRMGSGVSSKPEYRSAVKDTARFSRFGHYQIVGDEIGHGRVAIAFHSGNTRTPDATWTPWSAPSTTTDGAVDVPPGRYLQWKITSSDPAAGMAIDGVTVGYENRNVAPVIDAVTVLDPAVVYITGAYPPAPQVVEATNPDQYGIFTSLEPARETTGPGKKMYRKGFRTITWRAHDDNGDTLRYSLYFRRKGTDKWLRLRKNMEETSMNFDTSQLPDGIYELRLVASDILDNPDDPLTDTKEGIEFLVDNAPPRITWSSQGDDIVVQVDDTLSPVGKVEYSADAQRWILLTPTGGIADSPHETYRLKKSDLAGKFVVVRATDEFYNVATASIDTTP